MMMTLPSGPDWPSRNQGEEEEHSMLASFDDVSFPDRISASKTSPLASDGPIVYSFPPFLLVHSSSPNPALSIQIPSQPIQTPTSTLPPLPFSSPLQSHPTTTISGHDLHQRQHRLLPQSRPVDLRQQPPRSSPQWQLQPVARDSPRLQRRPTASRHRRHGVVRSPSALLAPIPESPVETEAEASTSPHRRPLSPRRDGQRRVRPDPRQSHRASTSDDDEGFCSSSEGKDGLFGAATLANLPEFRPDSPKFGPRRVKGYRRSSNGDVHSFAFGSPAFSDPSKSRVRASSPISEGEEEEEEEEKEEEERKLEREGVILQGFLSSSNPGFVSFPPFFSPSSSPDADPSVFEDLRLASSAASYAASSAASSAASASASATASAAASLSGPIPVPSTASTMIGDFPSQKLHWAGEGLRPSVMHTTTSSSMPNGNASFPTWNSSDGVFETSTLKSSKKVDDPYVDRSATDRVSVGKSPIFGQNDASTASLSRHDSPSSGLSQNRYPNYPRIPATSASFAPISPSTALATRPANLPSTSSDASPLAASRFSSSKIAPIHPPDSSFSPNPSYPASSTALTRPNCLTLGATPSSPQPCSRLKKHASPPNDTSSSSPSASSPASSTSSFFSDQLSKDSPQPRIDAQNRETPPASGDFPTLLGEGLISLPAHGSGGGSSDNGSGGGGGESGNDGGSDDAVTDADVAVGENSKDIQVVVRKKSKERLEKNEKTAKVIDSKICEAMNLVTGLLTSAVRQEMDELKEKIDELTKRNKRLSQENAFLRSSL